MCYTPARAEEAKKFLDEKAAKGGYGGRGHGGRKGKKGGKGGGARMLNFDVTHQTDHQDRTDQAARLLASLMTLGESPGGSDDVCQLCLDDDSDDDNAEHKTLNLDDHDEFDTTLWQPPRPRGWMVRMASRVRHYMSRMITFLLGFLAVMVVIGVVAYGVESRIQETDNPLVAKAIDNELVKALAKRAECQRLVLNVSGG